MSTPFFLKFVILPLKEITLTSIVTCCPEVVSTDLAGGAALLDLQSSTYFTVNTVGSFIWSLLQEPVDSTAIAQKVAAHFETTAEACKGDVLAMVRHLYERGLIRVMEPKTD